jgi:hypothetical protein
MIPGEFSWSGWNAWSAQTLRYAWPVEQAYRLQVLQRDPTVLVIPFADACDHLRLGAPSDPEAAVQQSLVERLVRAVSFEVERYIDMALSPQQWRLYTAGIRGGSFAYDPLTMPGGYYALAGRQVFIMPKAPLVSVESITIDGTLIDPATYGVLPDDHLGGIVFGKPVFPASLRYPDSVIIDFTCGYADPSAIPEDIKQAMFLTLGTWFVNREGAMGYQLYPMTDKLGDVPGVSSLLDHYRTPVLA